MSLGIYVHIEKHLETDEFVDYCYGQDASGFGMLRISKRNGEVQLLRPAVCDNKDHMNFHRAARKLRKHWEAGDMPEKTWWAS